MSLRRLQNALRRGPPHIVQHHIHARQRRAERLHQHLPGLVQPDRLIRAQLPQLLQHGLIAPGRNHPARAQVFRHLDSLLPRNSRRPVHQHRFARLQPRAAQQRSPRRQPRIAQRRCGHIVHLIRQQHRLARRRNAPLRHRPERSERPEEVHTPSIRQRAHAVVAGHKRQLPAAAVVTATGLSLHQIAQRRCPHLNQLPACIGARLAKRRIARRLAKALHHGCVHCFLPPLPHPLPRSVNP